jgi:hypothetical protein
MSKRLIIVLMSDRHKRLDPIILCVYGRACLGGEICNPVTDCP